MGATTRNNLLTVLGTFALLAFLIILLLSCTQAQRFDLYKTFLTAALPGIPAVLALWRTTRVESKQTTLAQKVEEVHAQTDGINKALVKATAINADRAGYDRATAEITQNITAAADARYAQGAADQKATEPVEGRIP